MVNIISPSIHSFFTTSFVCVGENAVKNILFRASALLLQFFVLRTFTFIAARQNAYTSYLMFAEDIVQKILYIVSRKFNGQAVLVLAFTIFISLAGLYDTLLWALDSPGYVTESNIAGADLWAHDLLTNPMYITLVSNPTENVHDINIDAAIAASLYTPGLNITLPGIIGPGAREIVPPVQPIYSAGPRIWLDEDGFSVSVDQTAMVTSRNAGCPVQTVSESQQNWGCWFNNTDDTDYLFSKTIGNPEIHWDGQHGDYLVPNRKDNPWLSLGTNIYTALMKQVFTVTKDRRRHTFLETVVKTSMITTYVNFLNNSEITDLIQRTLDPDRLAVQDIQTLANDILTAQANQTSATFGIFIQEPYASLSATVEFFALVSPMSNQRLYNTFRITSTNITLIRSETLSEAPAALPCNVFSTNLATGGQIRSSTCYSTLFQNKASFVTQLDSSAILILNDVLGDGTAATSAVAFNQTGWDWYVNASDHMDDLLTSRALILGGNRSAVQLTVQHNEAAISYLQLLLMLLPVLLLSCGAVVVLQAESMSYYNSSLLAAVCATTHITTRECKQVGYLREPPEITLELGKATHVYLRTPGGGMLANVGGSQVVACGMVTEPLIGKEGSYLVNDKFSASDWSIAKGDHVVTF